VADDPRQRADVLAHLVAGIACLPPIRRALAVDPVDAMRSG
jgi:ABC-type lipoprotein release transport system permease subunit